MSCTRPALEALNGRSICFCTIMQIATKKVNQSVAGGNVPQFPSLFGHNYIIIIKECHVFDI